MVDKIKEYVEQQHMLEKGDSVVMGISGGADSVAMLLAFSILQKEYDLSLYVVHVNHSIRKEASMDADYVKELCKKYQIPFYLFAADVGKMAEEQKKTVEEMGREYRYRCFYEVMERVGARILATAHHRGDQAETVLFHMIRGADLSGMTGIRPVAERTTDFGTLRIIRPLLFCEKSKLTSWLVSMGLSWREDITNQDNNYARNRLRNEVLPILKEINSQAENHIADLAEIMWEYESFFLKKVSDYIDEFVLFQNEYSCQTDRARLMLQENVLVMSIIYELLGRVANQKRDFTKENIRDVYQLMSNQSGKKIMLPHGLEAVISYEKLIIRKCFRKAESEYLESEETDGWREEIPWEERARLSERGGRIIPLPNGGQLHLERQSFAKMTEEERKKLLIDAGNSKNNYTKFFDCDTIKGTLCIRNAERDDYFVMNEAGDRKKLFRHFMDIRLPADERNGVVVLANGNEVLWIVGGRRCECFKIAENTQNILKVTYKGEKGNGSD